MAFAVLPQNTQMPITDNTITTGIPTPNTYKYTSVSAVSLEDDPDDLSIVVVVVDVRVEVVVAVDVRVEVVVVVDVRVEAVVVVIVDVVVEQ